MEQASQNLKALALRMDRGLSMERCRLTGLENAALLNCLGSGQQTVVILAGVQAKSGVDKGIGIPERLSGSGSAVF